MSNNVVKFLITGDAAGLVAAAEKGGASIESIGPKGSKVGKIVSDGMKAAAVGLIAFAAESVKVALEGEKSQAILDTAIKNTGASLKSVGPQYDALEAKGAKYGETNSQVRSGLAVLVTATGDTTQAAKLLGVTQDIASAKHLTLAAAAKLVGKVAEGNVGSLGRFGLATKDSAGKTLSAAAAMQELQTKFHGVSDEIAKTPAGKLAAFKAQFDDLEENVGNKLLPIIARFGGDAVQAIGKAEHAFDGLTSGEKKAVEIAGGVALAGLAIYKAWGPITTVVGGVQKAYGFLSGATKAAAEQEIAAAEERTAAEQAAAAESNAAFSSMGETFTAAAATITGAVGELTTAISSLGPTTEAASAEASAGISGMGVAAQTSAVELLAAAGEEDAALTSTGVAAQTAAAQVVAASAEAATGIEATGVAAQTSAAELLAAVGEENAALVELAAQAEITAGSVGGIGASGIGAGAGAAATTVGGEGALGLGLGGGAITGTLLPLALAASLAHGISQPSKDVKSLAKDFEGAPKLSASDASAAVANTGNFKINQEIPVLQQNLATIDPASKAYAVEAANIDKLTAALSRSYGVTHVAGGIQEAFSTAIGKSKSALDGETSGLGRAVSSLLSHTGATRNDTTATQINELATKTSATALSTYGKNLTDTINPVMAAVSAESGLTDAKTKASYANLALAEAVKQYGANSPQAIQASKDLASANNDQVTAAVNEQTALVNLAQTYQDGGKTVDEFKSTLQGLVSQGLITQAQADSMSASFVTYAGNINKIPGGKNTNLTATDKATPLITTVSGLVDALSGKKASVTIGANVSDAIANLNFLQSAIQAAARTDPSLYVTLTGHTQSSGGVTHHAMGGLLRAGQLSTVAENGPELAKVGNQTYFLSNQDAQIIPNHALQKVGGAASSATYKPAAATIVNNYVTVNVPVNADPAATGKALMQALHDADRAGAPVANALKQLVTS